MQLIAVDEVQQPHFEIVHMALIFDAVKKNIIALAHLRVSAASVQMPHTGAEELNYAAVHIFVGDRGDKVVPAQGSAGAALPFLQIDLRYLLTEEEL